MSSKPLLLTELTKCLHDCLTDRRTAWLADWLGYRLAGWLGYLRALALHVEAAGVPLHVHELVEIDELIACSSSEW